MSLSRKSGRDLVLELIKWLCATLRISLLIESLHSLLCQPTEVMYSSVTQSIKAGAEV